MTRKRKQYPGHVPAASVPTQPGFYRLDHANIGAKFTMQAKQPNGRHCIPSVTRAVSPKPDGAAITDGRRPAHIQETPSPKMGKELLQLR